MDGIYCDIFFYTRSFFSLSLSVRLPKFYSLRIVISFPPFRFVIYFVQNPFTSIYFKGKHR